MDTHLVTQAVISGLQVGVDELNETYANLSLSLSENAKLLAARINQLALDRRAELTLHKSFGVSPNDINRAHGGVSWNDTNYFDSAGDTVGTELVICNIGGTSYYIPASPNKYGPCHAHCNQCDDSCCCYGNL